MRLIPVVLLALAFLFLNTVYADTQDSISNNAVSHTAISSDDSSIPDKALPFLKSDYSSKAVKSKRAAKHKTNNSTRTVNCTGAVSVKVYPGSLRNNIQRIAARCGWPTLVWNAPYDYLWYGETLINGTDLNDVFGKMLEHYPVQAKFYEGNHVLAISARNLP